MKIIYNKILPTKKFKAINLFGIIFVRKEHGTLTNIQLNHESIHTAQAKEMLFLFFYIFYVFEWLFRLIQYRNSMEAYYNISFEREAYENQDNPNYLKQRKFYSFIKYYSKKQH
ncbi:hypothetical protein [Dysgonomonas sp. 520]|uniref:hypothetical protein n=1 Tax=Dysgonomonas sp. 520 TaxID=2302931 RepID=UPI0013D3B214|nr:hypothetical protein [Dysgonomonas sp. 520]NDW10703.1 hypothetical protein [Dysgonomonas sp. 520]